MALSGYDKAAHVQNWLLRSFEWLIIGVIQRKINPPAVMLQKRDQRKTSTLYDMNYEPMHENPRPTSIVVGVV